MTGFGYLPIKDLKICDGIIHFSQHTLFIVKRIKNLLKTVQAFSLYLGPRFYFVNKFLVIIFFLYDLFGKLFLFICLFIFFFI